MIDDLSRSLSRIMARIIAGRSDERMRTGRARSSESPTVDRGGCLLACSFFGRAFSPGGSESGRIDEEEGVGGGGRGVRWGPIAVEKVEAEPRLADLSTQWNLVFEAHSGTPEQVSLAMSQLMCRYSGAVHRYLLKAL